MAVRGVAGGTVGEVSFAASAAVGLLRPIAAQIDLFLGSVVGPIQAELQSSLKTSLELAVGVSLDSPLEQLKDLMRLLLQLEAALALGLSAPSLNTSASAHARLAAALKLKLAAITAAVEALVRLKTPALDLAAQVAASFGLGGVALLEFEAASLEGAGRELEAALSAGLDVDGVVIEPDAPVYGLALVTKSAAANAALRLIFRG